MATNTDHPNTLVGIATARIAFTEIPGGTNRVNNNLDHAIPDANRRFIHLLDALASLSISDAGKQVVAISLHKDVGSVTLTVAENEDVKDDLRDYIKGLWQLLKEYSTLPDGGPRTVKKLEIVKVVYIHSYEKLLKRFKSRRWLEKFEPAFNDNLAKFKETGAAGCLELLSTLSRVRETMDVITFWRAEKNHPKNKKKYKDLIPASKVTDDDWEKLITEMDGAMPDIKVLLENKANCDAWADALKGTVNVPAKAPASGTIAVPLFRAIEKLTSHHRFILQLLTYASSADGKDDLKCTLTVDAKKKDIGDTTVALPIIPVLENLLKPLLLAGTKLNDEVALVKAGVKTNFQLDLNDTTTVTYPGVVHCECSLIAKIQQNQKPPLSPFNYIGVSKLSCAACPAWIEAYNSTQAVQYYTRGTHGRWYPKWGMPPAAAVQTPTMLAEMKDVVGQAYKAHIARGGNVRNIVVSDSTDAKGTPPGHQFTDQEKRARVHMTSSERNARRAGNSTQPLPPPTK